MAGLTVGDTITLAVYLARKAKTLARELAESAKREIERVMIMLNDTPYHHSNTP